MFFVVQLIIPLLLVGLCCAFLTFYKYCFTYWIDKGVPILNPRIPFGDATDLFLGRCCFGELFANWYLSFKAKKVKHGGVYLLGKPVYVPVDIHAIKRIVITDASHFPNHGFYIDNSGRHDPFSKHIFNMENYAWRTLRSKLPSAFTSSKMKKMYALVRGLSNELNDVIGNYAEKDKSIEIKSVLSRFTTDIISKAAFGVESNTLHGQNSELLKQARVFFDYQWSRINNFLVFLVPRHILSLMRFQLYTKEFTKYFLNMFRKIVDQRAEENVKRNDLAELLIRLTDPNDEILQTDFEGKDKMDALTFEEMAAQMLVFLTAGFETSSSTQTFCLYELAMNPDIQTKLRENISEVAEKYNGDINYDALMEMEYLDRVVDETLRKYPIFPVVPRACMKDCYLPEVDFTVQKGTFVIVTNLGLQHDPEYFPNPDVFDPERFTTENKSKRPAAAYLPFGEGPRICIGKRFGLMQTKLGVATLVKNFRISISPKMKLPLKFAPESFVLKAYGDMWLDFEKISY